MMASIRICPIMKIKWCDQTGPADKSLQSDRTINKVKILNDWNPIDFHSQTIKEIIQLDDTDAIK